MAEIRGRTIGYGKAATEASVLLRDQRLADLGGAPPLFGQIIAGTGVLARLAINDTEKASSNQIGIRCGRARPNRLLKDELNYGRGFRE